MQFVRHENKIVRHENILFNNNSYLCLRNYFYKKKENKPNIWLFILLSLNLSSELITIKMKHKYSYLHQRILTLVLTIVALVAGQSAWAQTFTVTSSTSGTTTTFTVTVTEKTPTDGYLYYSGSTTRTYRFEVLDTDGFELAHLDRSRTVGTSISATNIFSEKSVTVFTTEQLVTDKGYGAGSEGGGRLRRLDNAKRKILNNEKTNVLGRCGNSCHPAPDSLQQ